MPFMRRVLPMVASVLVLLLVSVVGPPARAADKEKMPPPEPFGRFTVDQVERRLGRPGVFIFDGNPAEVYAEHHLPGAERLNHTQVKKRALPRDKDATLIFYCMNEL
jgi:rhodanese-like protein